MKKLSNLLFFAVLLCGANSSIACLADDMAEFRTWAMTPPKGWNSWDCYYSSVTETEVMQNAEYMRDNLKQYG